MPKVSIVIPIYNVEKYIDTCLKNICNNELTDIEIICVDDGSLDDSGMICDNYAKQDKRIKVIHKNNGGVSSARNVGMTIASGEYLYFLDPDDEMHSSMLSIMLNIAKQKDCQVVVCGYKTIPDAKVVIPQFQLNKPITPIEMIVSNCKIYSNNDLCFSWRFLFQTKIIKDNNLSFNEKVHIGEDTIFNFSAILKARRIFVIDKPFYYYTVNNENSAMKASYKKDLESCLIEQYNVKKKLTSDNNLNKYKSYMDDMALSYINIFLPMMIKNIYNGPEKDKKRAIKRILNYDMFRDSCKQIGFFYKCYSFKEYLVYIAIKYRLYLILYELYDKNLKKINK